MRTAPNWRSGNVLFGTREVPKLVWESPTSPGGRVIHGDCVAWMEGVQGRECYDLIFADPPFGIGVEYEGMTDKLSPSQYKEFTSDWIYAAASILRPGGVIYVHVPDHVARMAGNCLEEFGLQQIEWVIWHYRFGQCTNSGLINSKCHGLVFKKPGADHIFNANDIRVPSDRAAKYADARTEESATPGRRVPFDVWGADVDTLDGQYMTGDGSFWGRVTGSHSNSERRALHENQLPELYSARIIRAWSNPGSWVLDPFCGSGTTITVARSLGRHCVTVDQSQQYCESAIARTLQGPVRNVAG